MGEKSIVVSLLSGGIAGVATSAVSYLIIRHKIRQELQARIDFDLRNHRISAYKELWKTTRPLSLSADDKQLACSARDISHRLATWYFGNGGLFLSRMSQDKYKILQESLLKHGSTSLKDLKDYSPKIYETLRGDASTLRTYTSSDIGSRKEVESGWFTGVVKKVNKLLTKRA
ncbi:MAG: hypothetical protein GY928_15495 [Colwellia sp.]|nr:hypothetical protein [Colwellia sp.]